MVERHDEEQHTQRRRSASCLRLLSIERGHGPPDQIYNGLPNPRGLAVLGNVETIAVFFLMLIILALG